MLLASLRIKINMSIILEAAGRIAKLQPAKDIYDDVLEYLLWISSLYGLISFVPRHIAEVGVADRRNTVMFGHLLNSGEIEA